MLAENIAGGFENSKRTKKEDFKRERERLHSKIGRLTVEVDFLEKIQTARPVNRAELSIRRHCGRKYVPRSAF